MAEPWFDPVTFGIWFGAGVGGGGGSLMGLLGGLAGYLAPRGLGKSWILGAMGAFVVMGLGLAGFGVVALIAGQPYPIWYATLLPGLLFSGVGMMVIPGVRRVYAAAEERHPEAEPFPRE